MGEIIKMSCWYNNISHVCIAYLEMQNKFNYEFEKKRRSRKLIAKTMISNYLSNSLNYLKRNIC
jgi:hypothetical protein